MESKNGMANILLCFEIQMLNRHGHGIASYSTCDYRHLLKAEKTPLPEHEHTIAFLMRTQLQQRHRRRRCFLISGPTLHVFTSNLFHSCI